MASNPLGARSKYGHKRAFSLDNVDATEMVRKEKLARQLATRLPSIARPVDCPLFDHFFVFGQSIYKSDPVKPKCIFQYPPEKAVTLQALEQFVFPTGMPGDRDLSRAASSVLDYHSKNPQNAFAFLLTTSIKEVFYAICIVDEYLKPYPTFVPLTSGDGSASSSSDEIGKRDEVALHQKLTFGAKCYCMITRYPLFDLMFDVLLHLLDVEEKSLTLPIMHRTGDLNQINRILGHLWKCPPPIPGAAINLGIPRIPSYTRPMRHEDESLISGHCVPTLFWCLDKDQILTLVAAALLERKILFVSPNLRILSNCILSFIALLKPFVLQCVFIPVLPDDLLQIAEAPVPFIAGLANPKLTKQAREANEEMIVVDLPARRIYIPVESAVPSLPNVRGLSHAIDPYVAQLRKSFDKYVPPYKALKSQKDLVTELLRLLEQYITPYFEAFRRHCITSLTDNVTIFVKETYLIEETDVWSVVFFQPFLETQIFAHWCDQKLKEIDHQRQNRSAASSTKLPWTQRTGSATTTNNTTQTSNFGAHLARPASHDDLTSLASSSSSPSNHNNLPTFDLPLTTSGHHPKGLGSPVTRPRSSSVSTSTSNDEFVASLQFDFVSDDSGNCTPVTPPQARKAMSQSSGERSSSASSTAGSTAVSGSTTSLSSSDPKFISRPKSAHALSPIRED